MQQNDSIAFGSPADSVPAAETDASSTSGSAPTSSATASEAATLLQELEQARAQHTELNERYIRLAADFDNFRKRTQKEREDTLRYGAATTVEALLPVLDNLALAKQSLNEQSPGKTLYESFGLLEKQLLDTLAQVGLERIDPLQQPFDPNRHEAVARQETEEAAQEDTVVQVHRAGYSLHGKVLRPAMVVVAAAKPATTIPSALADDSASNGTLPQQQPASNASTNPFEL